MTIRESNYLPRHSTPHLLVLVYVDGICDSASSAMRWGVIVLCIVVCCLAAQKNARDEEYKRDLYEMSELLRQREDDDEVNKNVILLP